VAEFHAQKHYDPQTGITEEMWYDEGDGKIHVRRTANVEETYKENQIILASSPKDFHKNIGPMYHKARIPNIVIEKWLKEDGFNWYKSTDNERKQKINQHPEFHVRGGRI
jgi:hypothetical protein